jgi:integrase
VESSALDPRSPAWAMFAAQAGRDPHWIADQIGHTSAAFTLQVYQQTRNRRLTADERQAIWELMRFEDERSAP